jgi:acid phosphatase
LLAIREKFQRAGVNAGATYLLSLSVLSVSILGCAKPGGGRENLDAFLWVQTSAEYSAAVIGTYNAATDALERVVATDPAAVGQMVVVMDVDETVLSNSLYLATRQLQIAGDQQVSWDSRIALREATAIPGAIDFIAASRGLGVSVQFITNRQCRDRTDNTGDCPQKEDTLANLRQVGVNIDPEDLYLRGERPPDQCLSFLSDEESQSGTWIASDKTSRRQCVELDRDIVMLVGDQLSDFIGEHGTSTQASRDSLLDEYRDNWGRTWFLIPNPVYGHWLNLTKSDKLTHVRGE